MAHPDFVTGVTARLIDRIKTRPEWKPNTLKEVTDEEVDSFFDKEPTMPLLVNNEETAKYKEYPHAWIGLPREREIVNFMQGKPEVQKEEVVKYFADRMKGKQGVKEKVEEVFDRMTDVQ